MNSDDKSHDASFSREDVLMADETMDTTINITKVEESFARSPSKTAEMEIQTEPIIEEVHHPMLRMESEKATREDVDMNHDAVALPPTNNQIVRNEQMVSREPVHINI